MRRILLAVTFAALGASEAAHAQGRDCRWFGEVMGCKDGQGHWRRVGDDEILGSYVVAKPKPKPATAVVPATVPASAAPVAALPASPPPPPSPPQSVPAPTPPTAPVVRPSPAPAAQRAAPVAAPEAQPHRSWWRRWLDSIWRDIQTLLRLIGVRR